MFENQEAELTKVMHHLAVALLDESYRSTDLRGQAVEIGSVLNDYARTQGDKPSHIVEAAMALAEEESWKDLREQASSRDADFIEGTRKVLEGMQMGGDPFVVLDDRYFVKARNEAAEVELYRLLLEPDMRSFVAGEWVDRARHGDAPKSLGKLQAVAEVMGPRYVWVDLSETPIHSDLTVYPEAVDEAIHIQTTWPPIQTTLAEVDEDDAEMGGWEGPSPEVGEPALFFRFGDLGLPRIYAAMDQNVEVPISMDRDLTLSRRQRNLKQTLMR